jgi:hypothetical protein
MNKSGANPGMDALVSRLGNLHNDCLRPPYRTLANISERLRKLYPDYRGELTTLSPTAISEVLNGKRKRPLQPGWLASFVLSCQHYVWRSGAMDDDPGAASLPEWFAALRDAHHACAADVPGGNSEGVPSASKPVYRCPPSTVQLTPAQRQRVESYGRYAQGLIGQLQSGNREAVYRVALLLGADSAHFDAACTLLLHAATALHDASLELLDSSRGLPSSMDMARHVRGIAESAHAGARYEEAQVYYECAAEYTAPSRA